MFLKKIIALLRPKKKASSEAITRTINTNYACADKTLEQQIKAYLKQKISTKHCLQSFIEHMAYDNSRRIKENELIFDILEDFLKDATWKEDFSPECGDYDPARPEPWLRCVYETYSNKLFYIKNAEELLINENKEISVENITKATAYWGHPVTEEDFNSKKDIETKEKQLREKIVAGDFTPLEGIHMVKDNWDLLYPYQSTYEAIEYCVAASENHSTPEYFYSAFRDFGYKMSDYYSSKKNK